MVRCRRLLRIGRFAVGRTRRFGGSIVLRGRRLVRHGGLERKPEARCLLLAACCLLLDARQEAPQLTNGGITLSGVQVSPNRPGPGMQRSEA